MYMVMSGNSGIKIERRTNPKAGPPVVIGDADYFFSFLGFFTSFLGLLSFPISNLPSLELYR
jgi:hypothetical protein